MRRVPPTAAVFVLGYFQAAYRDWLCAITMPYYDDAGVLVRPCAYYAEMVENRCPYMSPQGHHQYAGEPLFMSSRQYLYFIYLLCPRP